MLLIQIILIIIHKQMTFSLAEIEINYHPVLFDNYGINMIS